MLIVDNVEVSGLNRATVASGIPMYTAYDPVDIQINSASMTYSDDDPHYKRAVKLCRNTTNSGHCTFLSGIVVHMDITATVKWWVQWQRYHFQQIVSSMSTMHRLRQMMRAGTIHFNENTDAAVVDAFLQLLDREDVTDEQLAYSCPMGLELTASVVTNYLQLRTIYSQRRNHKLAEWRDFCNFVENSLPLADAYITVGVGSNK